MENNEYKALVAKVKRETGAYSVRVQNGLIEYLVAIGSAKIPSRTDVYQFYGYTV